MSLMRPSRTPRPDNTKKAIIWGVRKFEDWLQKRGKVCDYHTVTSAELGELLRKFYAEVKAKKQGTPLTPSTLNMPAHVDAFLNTDNVLPMQPARTAAVYNISLPPQPVSDLNSSGNHTNPIYNILANATFNSCTLNCKNI